MSLSKETGTALAREFAGYVSEALRARRKTGVAASDDVISSLMGTAVEGAALSDEDIVSILRNWTASCSTMAAALGILVCYLATHADMQEQLRHEPPLLAAAIEEILRTDGPLVANHRTATREVEIADRKIGAGEKLSLNWIAANRDGGFTTAWAHRMPASSCGSPWESSWGAQPRSSSVPASRREEMSIRAMDS